jgi:hypothetical protein
MTSSAFPSPVAAFALAAVLALPGLARADASPADASSPAAPPPTTGWTAFGPVRPVVGLLLTGTVGDNRATFSNPDGSSASGNPSRSAQAFAGAEFALAANGLRLRLSAGLQASTLSSPSGHERLTRVPLEATLLYPVGERLRVGGGLRYAARLRFSGAGGNTSDQLNAAPGVIGAIDYRLSPHLLADFRYVYERYELSGSHDYEASHWGIGLTAMY